MKSATFLLKGFISLSLLLAVISQRRPPGGRQPNNKSGRNFTINFRKRLPFSLLPPPPLIFPPPIFPPPGIFIPGFPTPRMPGRLEEKEEKMERCSEQLGCANFFEQRFPTPNGECNNRINPRQGATEQSYKRYLPAQYADGYDTLRTSVNGGELPSARNISNFVQETLSTDTPYNQMLPFWGQFVTHDVTSVVGPEASTVRCECDVEITPGTGPECINVPIPPNDRQYKSDPERTKTCFTTERSLAVANSEHCNSKVREQLNELSGYLDLGIIYGSSNEHLEAIRDLRDVRKGELIEVHSHSPGVGIVLPSTNHSDQITPAAKAIFCPEFLRKPPTTLCRVSGEPRTNENSALQSQHTVWMKMHNIVVRQLRRLNPRWDSDRLLQIGKLIVTALHQQVTYKHFLPIILGHRLMKHFDLTLQEEGYYYGYESSYSAGIATSFATAAFRMHTLVNEMLTRPDRSWNKAQARPIRVRESLFNVGIVTEPNSGGVSSFIRGLVNESSLRFDPTFSEDLRDFLSAPNFAPSGSIFGTDLLARNIQRGRDHGLPTYSQVRVFCGFPALKRFQDLRRVMTRARAEKLAQVYSSVSDIDLYAGGISETAVEGGVVGPTFACLIAYQFRDLKKGDRFWHENPPPIGSFTESQLTALKQISFPRLLCEVIDNLQTIQPRPLKKAGPGNARRRCSSYPRLNLSAFGEVQLTNVLDKIKQSTQKTAWFSTSSINGGQPFTVSELYQWLLTYRPTEVCQQVTDTETRNVHGRDQVRFQCLAGTIRYSDFPPVPSDRFIWSRWYTNSASGNDFRVNPNPTENECPVRYAIQAQTLTGIPAGETGDVFNRFGPFDGLVCLGRDQPSRRCNRYRIRFLCRRR